MITMETAMNNESTLLQDTPVTPVPVADAGGPDAWRGGCPRLRENLWQIDPEAPQALVETMDGKFEVPTGQAFAFAAIRSHCTGHNTPQQVAERSGTDYAAVLQMLAALSDAGLTVTEQSTPSGDSSLPWIRARLMRASALWSRALSRQFVANELIDGVLPKTVLLGWLIEMYHYVHDFPEAIASGASHATGELAKLLQRYVEEERGHERFVLQTLVNLGLGAGEVMSSQPLVSTRLIGLLMRELFALAPESVLLVAALVEADDVPPAQLDDYREQIERIYQLPPGAMKPYFAHQAIDASLGHSRLLSDNLDLFNVGEGALLDQVVNKLHDLKHAFELQSHEIKMYYGDLGGKYFPRQPMRFASL